MEAKKYKAKLHIASGPFSFIELDVEDTSAEIVRVNDWMLNKYKNNQK